MGELNIKDHDGQIELKTQFLDFKDSVLHKFDEFKDKIDEVTEKENATEKFIGGMGYEEFARQVKQDAQILHDARQELKFIVLIVGIIWPILLNVIGYMIIRGINPLNMFKLP